MSDEHYHYVTTNAEMVAAFDAWQEERRTWSKRVQKLGRDVGRQPVVSLSVMDECVSAFARKKGESADPRDYAKTAWVVTKAGYLRPRLTTPEGKALDVRMRAISRVPHPANILKGIPKHYDFLSRPGMWLVGKQLIVTYGEPVKHDRRWREMKKSEYWRLREKESPKASSG